MKSLLVLCLLVLVCATFAAEKKDDSKLLNVLKGKSHGAKGKGDIKKQPSKGSKKCGCYSAYPVMNPPMMPMVEAPFSYQQPYSYSSCGCGQVVDSTPMSCGSCCGDCCDSCCGSCCGGCSGQYPYSMPQPLSYPAPFGQVPYGVPQPYGVHQPYVHPHGHPFGHPYAPPYGFQGRFGYRPFRDNKGKKKQ